ISSVLMGRKVFLTHNHAGARLCLMAIYLAWIGEKSDMRGMKRKFALPSPHIWIESELCSIRLAYSQI
ncbi:MAG: hypothetical protein MN733_22490, partial [Nitrososphaera sp.]|nr:hypothetical protein [Nitrososphaera sp.]